MIDTSSLIEETEDLAEEAGNPSVKETARSNEVGATDGVEDLTSKYDDLLVTESESEPLSLLSLKSIPDGGPMVIVYCAVTCKQFAKCVRDELVKREI